MDDDPQDPWEIAAHFGPDGPVQAVQDWVARLVDDKDFDGAWERMTPEFQRERVVAWVDNNADHPWILEVGGRDAAIEGLLEETAAHPLWRHFANIELDQYGEVWAAHQSWGAFSRPRPVSPGVEIVVFMVVPEDMSEPMVFNAPTLITDAIPFYVHRSDHGGWLIGGRAPAA